MQVYHTPPEDGLCTFVTDWGSLVTYRRPSDDFLRASGGDMEAYRIFWREDYLENMIAFLNGDRYGVDFCQCAGEDVRGVWKAWYGPLVDFSFSRNTNVIEVCGRTAEKELDACIFPDGGGTIEVLLEIDLLNTPEAVQRQFREEFEAVMSSFRIEYFENWSAPPPPPRKAASDKKYILPEEGRERNFLRVQLALTCVFAVITFYPICEAWNYRSFGGIGSLILIFLLGPGLAGLIAEAVLFFLSLRKGRMEYALAAYIIQIICGLPATCLLLIDPVPFCILGVHTVLLVLAFTGLILYLARAYQRR